MKIKNLSFKYSNQSLLDNINVTIHDHSITAIIGESGTGKSTLFKLITNEVNHYDGEIINHKSISLMPQGDTLLPWLNVFDNIIISYTLSKKPYDKQLILNLLEKFNLLKSKDLYPHQLSGGMKTRVMIIRSFVEDKDLILLDEPFQGLDLLNKKNIYKYLLDINKEFNKTIIFITHDINEAIYLSNYILLLKDKTITKEFLVNDKLTTEDIIEYL